MGEHRFAADLVRHHAWIRTACWRQRRMAPRLRISLVLLRVLLVIVILRILLTSMWRISSTLVLCRINLRMLVVTRRLRLRARLEFGLVDGAEGWGCCSCSTRSYGLNLRPSLIVAASKRRVGYRLLLPRLLRRRRSCFGPGRETTC
jgi:hypothetical protein